MEFFRFLCWLVLLGSPIAAVLIRIFWYDKLKVWIKRLIIACMVAIPCTIAVYSVEIVPTGFTGVKVTVGQVDSMPLSNGWYFKMPFIQSIKLVNNKQQDIVFDAQIWSETSQRTTIFYEKVTVTYRINGAKSAWIYANVADYENSLINEGILQSALKASSKQLVDEDATNRSVIEPLCMEYLQKAVNEKYGEEVVLIVKVIIGNADFEESYNNTLAAKQQAKIDAEKQQIENKRQIEKAEADAKVRETQANADANVKLIEAEAKAKAEVIEAEAKAKANELLQESLNDQIITKMWVEKWNGQLPIYMPGSEAGSLIGIGMPTANATPTPSPTTE